ncbi:ATP-dependent DNA helicase [Trichonephila clavipes]|nr:ATP-dependent DNA helicase [Trichonephila clavipes]
MARQRKNSEETWEAKRRDIRAQSTCLEMSGPNGHVHSFHNEMVPHLFAAPNMCGDIGKQFRQFLLQKDEIFVMVKSRHTFKHDSERSMLRHVLSGRGSQVVLVSDRGLPCHEFEPSTTKDPPSGCGKTFVIKLMMGIYNRYTNNDGYCHACITCASTVKAAVAISGTTVHTVIKISFYQDLHSETAQQCRTLFKYINVIIIDDISMISAQLLLKVDSRLKQKTRNCQSNFGGLDIILIEEIYVNYHQFVLRPSIRNRNRPSLDRLYGEI